jgi:hypothetical protein
MDAISGAMNIDAVVLPSTCISSRIVPDVSTSIMTGGNSPGTLADAMSTFRNSLSAAGPPCMAMAAMSQMTVRSLSRSVVAIRRSRPFAASTAMARSISSVA